MEIKVDNLTKLLQVLSWRNLLQFATLIIMIGVAYGLWDNKTVVYNTLKIGARVETDGPLLIVLSEPSRQYVDTLVAKNSEIIAGIQILSVDFKKNSIISSYVNLGDPVAKSAYDKFVENRVAPTPLFTNNEAQNQRIIDLINGEFRCKDVKDTLYGKLVTGSDKTIKYICSIGIPPYYGKFSGYMNIYLLKVPTESEVNHIRQLARDSSLKIYEADVSSKREKNLKHE